MHKNKFYFIYTLLGFISIIGQIILIRKFLIIFYGNELTIGTLFTGWMVWTGAGSIVFGGLADKFKRIPDLLSVVLVTISFLLLITIFAVHCIKPLLNIPVSEIVSLPAILIISSLSISPLCILIGFSFALCSKLSGGRSSTAVGRVYLYEALGAAAGGILYSWIGINYSSPFQTALIIVMLTSLTAAFLLAEDRKIKYICLSPGIVSLLLLLPGVFDIDAAARDIRWKGYNPIYSINSRFSELTLTQNSNEYTLFADSSPLFTYPDKNHAENISHLAMIQHPDPKSVLLIGGGIRGIIDELFKHPLLSVDYLQIDPAITEIEKKYIPDTSKFLSDNRLRIHHTDGRYFIKNLKKAHIYDVIIVNLPDPANARLNRFYTVQFFSEAKKALKHDGIILFSAGETSNYIPDIQAQFLSSVYKTVRSVFKTVIVMPLDQNYFAASDKKEFLTSDPKKIVKRINNRGVSTKFLQAYYINFDLSEERINYLLGRINSFSESQDMINEDLNPITYYYGTMLWGSRFNAWLPEIMMVIKDIPFFFIIIFPILISILLFIAGRYRRLTKKTIALSGIGVMGFAGISLEIVILIAFQVIHGYLYYRIGLVITAFMVGLSAGAFLIHKNIFFHKKINTQTSFFILLAGLALYQLVVIYLIKYLTFVNTSSVLSTSLFITAMFTGAVLCGMIFQTGADIYITRDKSIGAGSGRINGIDHIGAAIGGFITSIFLIPIYGLIKTLIFVMVLIGSLLIIIAVDR